MPVIAMTREMGSLGRDVALGLAEELGIELVQHEIVANVADKMHVGESLVSRFLEGKAGLLERWGVNENKLSLYTKEEILDRAAEGNVLIRGWGATYVLRAVPHVLCVRVCAPIDRRTRVLMERIGVDNIGLARKEVEKNDGAHSKTMLHLFHADYQDSLLYDMVLNTSKVSVPACVAMIKNLLAGGSFEETPESSRILESMRLEARIDAALNDNPSTAPLPPSFEARVEPGGGVVVLSGIAYETRFRAAAEEVVAKVPGVTRVVNNLHLITNFQHRA